MSTSMKGDYALEQENFGTEQIEKAKSLKDNLKKIAKKMAERELSEYDEKKNEEINEKITQLNLNDNLLEEIQNKGNEEVELIKNSYNNNKEKVIDFLFKNVLTVKYEVPDVVKGCFEEKFGIKDE
jgi:hypothetical protein